MRSTAAILALVVSLGSAARLAAAPPKVKVGSKQFTESVILGELLVQLARETGAEATHLKQLGATGIVWNALLDGQIDAYVEYTGTITQELLPLAGPHTVEAIRAALAQEHIKMSRPLGYNNTYALGMKESMAERLGIRTISDLRDHPDLKFGFTNEFKGRADCWPTLQPHYHLPQQNVQGMDHALAYAGLETGAIDVTDLYETDPQIRNLGLRVLDDDLHHFPRYYAVILYREDLERRAPNVVEALLRLEGRLPHAAILEMNAQAQPRSGTERMSESRVAAEFLARNPFFHPDDDDLDPGVVADERWWQRLPRYTVQHLLLVIVSLTAAIVIAIPLGIAAARWPTLGQGILGATGIVQTIPSLALLVILTPLLGLGPWPAILALFLYSLLPIVRNTYAGLHDIPLSIRESAIALGLPSLARLRLTELPMASRAILAGIKTSAVINVGTATLGGLVGAGGYGDPIITGLRLNRPAFILEGAIPAALLALLVQGLFELAERFLVPRGLQLSAESQS